MRVLINDYLTEVERVHFDEKKTKDDINSGLLGAKTISSSKGCLILELKEQLSSFPPPLSET